ncbi:helicase associated domain-containing protein, partial [Streptomyces actinomycinicus]|uniref:helicase associated domain-containing protein n=1 Tax=Streptomyces actinomycinicus TaxID=1695166 RepID=UPI0035F4386A
SLPEAAAAESVAMDVEAPTDEVADAIAELEAEANGTQKAKKEPKAKKGTDVSRELHPRKVGGNDWPRHNKTEDRDERVLGVWLHTQRIDYRAGKLTAAKEAELNTVIPGWRQGRAHRGRHRRPKNQQSPVTGGSVGIEPASEDR